MMKILIIEDEKKLAAILKEGLEEQAYFVDLAYDGEIGLEKALSTKYDLVIIDIILPRLSGLEVCRKIRTKNDELPIIMLTALGTTEDKLAGFDSGADDYIIKPFEFRELLARIKAQTKKTMKPKSVPQIYQTKSITLHIDNKVCVREGKEIKLTIKEYSLLEYFILNQNRVITRSELADKVWNIRFDTGTNIVDVYVNYLRKKIEKGFEKKLIHTHVGIGYIFKED